MTCDVCISELPVDTSDAEVDSGVDSTLSTLPVDTLLYLNATAAALTGGNMKHECTVNRSHNDMWALEPNITVTVGEGS